MDVVKTEKDAIKIELKVKLHEKGGCYLAGKARPGMSKAKVLELLPEIVIGE